MSVIIPIYNTEVYLADCLDSVASNIEEICAEALLIDDGSTDRSSIIAQQYAYNDRRFKYYRTENNGLGAARNYGVSRARGEYLFFVDSDDLLLEGTLSNMLKAAKFSNADVAVCDVARFQSEKTMGSALHISALTPLANNVTTIHESPWLVNNVGSWGKLIKHSYYKSAQLSFLEGTLYEDVVTVFAMHYQASRISIIRTCGYLWRVRSKGPKSITQNMADRTNLEDRVATLRLLLSYLDDYEVEEEIREQLAIRIARFDLIGYINLLPTMEDGEALAFLDLIGPIAEEAIGQNALLHVPMKFQQLLEDIRKRDLNHIRQVVSYIATDYSSAKVWREGCEYKIAVPDDLFTIPTRNYKNDYDVIIPMGYIEKISIYGLRVVIKGCVRASRISMPHPTKQLYRGFLVNDITGKKVPLDCVSCKREGITKSRRLAHSHKNYQTDNYNYEGCGFRLTIDFSALDEIDNMVGNNCIVLEYRNPIYSGVRTIRGVSAAARMSVRSFSITMKRYRGIIAFDARNTPIVQLQNVRKQN